MFRFNKYDVREVLKDITDNIDNTVRFIPEDKGTLIGLPRPYTVPCLEDEMQNMFYWDTYFINVGLLKLGLTEQAANNTENLLHLVKKFGCVPNGNRTFFLNRSQPPFLSMMVKDVFNAGGDKDRLNFAYDILKREYSFYMKKRITPTGLNRYYHHATEEEQIEFFEDVLKDRIPFNIDTYEEKLEIANHYLSEAESGWDFTPRFEKECANYNPVDLNSLLYIYEKNFLDFSRILCKFENSEWEKCAEKRKTLLNECCWDKNSGLYFDYNYINKSPGSSVSLAAYTPLWANIPDKQQAGFLKDNLFRFRYEYGLSICEGSDRVSKYQWDYPNGWPPLFYIVIEGLNNYGFTCEAKRISEKYLSVLIKNFKETGKLWEKYNITDGSINVNNEYEMPPMYGWTAGVFLHCAEFYYGVKVTDLL